MELTRRGRGGHTQLATSGTRHHTLISPQKEITLKIKLNFWVPLCTAPRFNLPATLFHRIIIFNWIFLRLLVGCRLHGLGRVRADYCVNNRLSWECMETASANRLTSFVFKFNEGVYDKRNELSIVTLSVG